MAEHINQVQRAFTAYSVQRELGSGGMATVYLALDKKHDRNVAIKLLDPDAGSVIGAERFLREIRVTANLQHPHIMGLIDSGLLGEDAGDLSGRLYYVMPYVDGESLRQRLDREQQLPISDAVRIATEVASALDYAHRHGVIHRDIKPENILLHDGSAIVADFGIALAVTQAGGPRMTKTGMSLGTPSYMSPEQAMGERTITARSDIYSLGTVTYEMLAGEPPFVGPTVQIVVARVMNEEPRPLTTQRRSVPPHVAAAVSRALEKVPVDRFGSAHEFAEALNDSSVTRNATPVTTSWNGASTRLRGMFYGATAVAMLMTAVALWGWARPAPSKPVLRYNLALDTGEALGAATPWWGRLAISPDGSLLAYTGGPHADLLIRRRDQLHARAVPGTEGAETPFFSPDGSQVGFLMNDTLRIASINGSPPILISDSLTGTAGASWGRDGLIYIDGVAASDGLLRVEAKPGALPTPFTTLDTARREIDHIWPDVLPNGKGVLFTDLFSGKNEATTFAIAIAEIPSGKHRVLVGDAMFARYAASGHLLYVTPNKTLMVVPFDQQSMKITGEPTALVEGLRLGGYGGADLTISETGTLVYVAGGRDSTQEVVWVTRDGAAQSVDSGWQGMLGFPALSPDGKRLAVMKSPDAFHQDIWIKQLDRGPSIRLSLQGGEKFYPAWTPDGQSVTFSLSTDGVFDLWTKRADGSAPAALQFHGRRPGGYGAHWSRDGTWLIFQTGSVNSAAGDILGLRPRIDTTAVPLVATRFTEMTPALSPDGRWLAYASNESGQFEIYVVPFPNTGAAKWAVSSRGGTDPVWSHRGSELFYRDASGNLVTVRVNSAPTFSVGPSTVLFQAKGFLSSEPMVAPQYAVAPDDRRFLMLRQAGASTPDKVIVVDNWFEELKARTHK